jgi:hypothetical protein
MRLATFLVFVFLLAGGVVVAEEPTPAPDTAAMLQLVDRLTQTTPVRWTEADLEALRAGTRVDPRAVITRLVERLRVDEGVPAEPFESQIHSVCGNALTLLDRLTSENVGGTTKDWIGFSTRDHRGRPADDATVYGPWRAWLKVRENVPVDEWFWGISYAELAVVLPLLKKGEGEWGEGAVARVKDLGRRVYPYLLDKLVDEGWSGDGYRVCDRANTLLRALTGKDLGEIVRHELLRLDPDSSERKLRYPVRENHASMALFQRRWTEALLAAE